MLFLSMFHPVPRNWAIVLVTILPMIRQRSWLAGFMRGPFGSSQFLISGR